MIVVDAAWETTKVAVLIDGCVACVKECVAQGHGCRKQWRGGCVVVAL